MNDFTERTILLNERFYWTNDLTERLFSEKTNKIDGKWTIILRRNEINFFLKIKKTDRNSSFMNDKRELKKKSNAPISIKERVMGRS